MTSDMLSPDELAAIKQQKETEPMEPEPTTHTVATNDLPAKWMKEQAEYPDIPAARPAAAAVRLCARELQESLNREAAAHEETARELAQDVKDELSLGGHHLEEMLAAALASVRRAALRDAWATCPVTGEPHAFTEDSWVNGKYDRYCDDCWVLRSAASPASAPTPEQQRERSG